MDNGSTHLSPSSKFQKSSAIRIYINTLKQKYRFKSLMYFILRNKNFKKLILL